MPELPEVEYFKQYFDATALHKIIKEVTVKNSEILGSSSAKEFDTLEGQKFQSTKRYGKYLFAKTSRNCWLTIHFGMTGNLKYFKHIEDEPSHSRLLLKFSNGFFLSYDCQRKFGKIELTRNIDDFVEKKNLGPDILSLNFQTFKKRLENRRGIAKSILMNQHIFAGVGNIYSDEILFQAGINPLTRINKLDTKTLKKLFETTNRVLKIAIDVQTKSKDYPDTFLIPYRTKEGTCPKGKSKLKRIKVSGRTSFYCPKHQKKSF